MQSVKAVKEEQEIQAKPKPKMPKGETMRISLRMFREGKSIADIVAERGFALSTIEGHLCSFIPTGEVAIEELVSTEKIAIIQEALDKSPKEVRSSEIREMLGDEFTFGEIRAVMSMKQKV